MSLRVVLGLLVLCGARRALADRAVIVDVTGQPPFAAAELGAALRVRLGDGAPVRVRVVATVDGVVVEARGEARSVALGGRAGADAARLVALAATDLIEATPAPELPPLPPGLVAATPAPERLTIGVVGAAAAWDGVLGGVTADLAVPRGGWLATLDVGGASLVGGKVGLDSAIVRGGGGRRIGPLELRAGVTLVPLIVQDGAGDTTVLFGGGASARLRLPIAAATRLVIAAGADAFATRTEYMSNGVSVTATPWLAPWIAAGVEVTP